MSRFAPLVFIHHAETVGGSLKPHFHHEYFIFMRRSVPIFLAVSFHPPAPNNTLKGCTYSQLTSAPLAVTASSCLPHPYASHVFTYLSLCASVALMSPLSLPVMSCLCTARSFPSPCLSDAICLSVGVSVSHSSWPPPSSAPPPHPRTWHVAAYLYYYTLKKHVCVYTCSHVPFNGDSPLADRTN